MSDNLPDAWKRLFGLDFFDTAVHTAVTLTIAFWASYWLDHPAPGIAVLTASLVWFSWRRGRALSRLPEETSGPAAGARIEELEARVAELEQSNARVMELEERVDFAERLLGQIQAERPGLPRAPIEGVRT